MKILICAAYYYPNFGGYIKNIHELAKRLVKNGHTVHILTCNTHNIRNGVIDGVPIIRLSCWNILNRTYPIPKPTLDLCGDLFLKGDKDYDLVITQTRFFSTSLFGYLYSKIHHVPLIHVERGSCHTVLSNKLFSLLAKMYDHSIGTLIVKSATYNIGISQTACDFIKHLGGKNIHLIYNGIEILDLPYKPQSEYINIVYTGRLIYAKGIQDLIQAFEVCSRTYKNLQLNIIGDGNYRQSLEKQVQQLTYGKQVHFLGEMDFLSLMKVLCESDIFVNPSYSEGLPTSVMEALSVKLPAIATDAGGTRELIENHKTGILFQPHDVNGLIGELINVIENRESFKSSGVEGYKVVKEKFDWDKIVGQWEELLKEI